MYIEMNELEEQRYTENQLRSSSQSGLAQHDKQMRLNKSSSNLDPMRQKIREENLEKARAQTHSRMIVPGPGWYATNSAQISQKVLGGRFGSSLRPEIA